jgi:ubiquinone/menaquinone biosynthesis C-methylase UbiE
LITSPSDVKISPQEGKYLSRRSFIMDHAGFFKSIFKGVFLEVEDLLLLESFQIEYLAQGVPEREFAAVLWANPIIQRFLVKKCRRIKSFLEQIMAKYPPAGSKKELDTCADKLVWTIADYLVYSKCPEVYDNLEFHHWDFREITSITPLNGKVVIDGGAGTGRVALEAARAARQVYAIEPVTRSRQFIHEKAAKAGFKNIFVMDGFLDSIPLPDGIADVMITSHALGWRLDNELKEFQRVVKKGGYIIHCPGTAEVPEEVFQHSFLISPDWGYQFMRYKESDGWKRKYWKQIKSKTCVI